MSTDNTYKEVCRFKDQGKYYLAEKRTTLYEARNYAITKLKVNSRILNVEVGGKAILKNKSLFRVRTLD